MRVNRRFLIGWAAWGAAISGFAWLVSLMAGNGDPGHLTRWVAGAMMLAAYPAGVIGSRDVIRWERPLRPLVAFAVATVTIGAALFAVGAYIGPGLGERIDHEPKTWSLGERIERFEEAERTAIEEGSLAAWQWANRIGWEIDHSVTSGLIAIAFAWIGALLTAWLPADLRREARFAVLVGAGLFLLLTGYLMTENGYELLLLRTVGPAFVTAWFPLLAPGMGAAGLAIPTLARMWEARRDRPPGE